MVDAESQLKQQKPGASSHVSCMRQWMLEASLSIRDEVPAHSASSHASCTGHWMLKASSLAED